MVLFYAGAIFRVLTFKVIPCQLSEILFSCSQRHQGPPNISKSALCHDQLFAILCIFSGIYLVNYVLMNSAANVFYSAGLVLVTFQDAMSLMEQVFSLLDNLLIMMALRIMLKYLLTINVLFYMWILIYSSYK